MLRIGLHKGRVHLIKEDVAPISEAHETVESGGIGLRKACLAFRTEARCELAGEAAEGTGSAAGHED